MPHIVPLRQCDKRAKGLTEYLLNQRTLHGFSCFDFF